MFKNILRLSHPSRFIFKRTFLSESFKCTEAWNNRLKAEIFKKVDFNDLYYQLDRSFQIGWKISVLDADIYANALQNDDTFLPELEDILFRLRLNPECGSMYESTNHAVVRYYLQLQKYDNLIRILDDRLNFGIFLDSYLASLAMDTFIKKEDYLSASRIAVLQMLQEDFDHPLVRYLSLYSCYKYLMSDQVWPVSETKSSDDDDEEEEEVKVRVMFLRNPYFDDHFDIKEPNKLIGKTLYMAGKKVNDPIGTTSQLIGLTLYEKYKELEHLIKNLQDNNIEVYKDELELVKQFLTKPPKIEKPEVSEDVKEQRENLIKLVNQLQSSGKMKVEKFESDLKEQITNIVKQNEAKMIEEQCKIYHQWEQDREQNILDEIEEDNRKKTIEEIEKTKIELQTKEDEIFYFDNEDKWEMIIEENLKKKEEIDKKMPQKKKKEEDQDYIPPEITKKKSY